MKTKTLVLTPGSRSTLTSYICRGFTCIFKIPQQLFSLQFKTSECYNTSTHKKNLVNEITGLLPITDKLAIIDIGLLLFCQFFLRFLKNLLHKQINKCITYFLTCVSTENASTFTAQNHPLLNNRKRCYKV